MLLAVLSLEAVDSAIIAGAEGMGVNLLDSGPGQRLRPRGLPAFSDLIMWAPDAAASLLGASAISGSGSDDTTQRSSALGRIVDVLLADHPQAVAAAVGEAAQGINTIESQLPVPTQVLPARLQLLRITATMLGIPSSDIELALDAVQRRCPVLTPVVRATRRSFELPDEEQLAAAVALAMIPSIESGLYTEAMSGQASSSSSDSSQRDSLVQSMSELSEDVESLLDSLGLSQGGLQRTAILARAQTLHLSEGEWTEGTAGAAWTGILLPSFTRQSELAEGGDRPGYSKHGRPMHAAVSWPKRPGMSAWRNVTFSRFGAAN